MEDKHVLITGCGGMLGESMYKTCIENYKDVLATDIDLNEPWLKHLDVREIQECENIFQEFKPHLVIHLAALTDLEYCENNPEEAWKTNALGTENIALMSKKYGATMVYISTAGVFGGEKERFTDFDFPNPLSYYAKSKYHGEKFVQQFLDKYFIFRAGWMMGGGIKKDKKFIKKIYNQIKEGKTELNIVNDKAGNPTYTWDFSRSIFKILPTSYYGLYNQVCLGNSSRLEITKEFIRLLGLTDKIKIKEVNSDFFASVYFAPRPPSERLVNLKLISRNINFMRDWKVCLAEYTQDFKKDYENSDD